MSDKNNMNENGLIELRKAEKFSELIFNQNEKDCCFAKPKCLNSVKSTLSKGKQT